MNKFQEYDDVIKSWLREGIVEYVPEESVRRVHYLPHRAVIKQQGTTKIRPVFDASSKDVNGNSLNGCMETGPNLIELIPITLTALRLHPIGLSADIEKAFLQIKLDPVDRNYLRFLWWEKDEVIEPRHCRVVFGVCCSPFLLASVLRRHLQNPPSHLSRIAQSIEGAFYVDNCLSGVSEKSEIPSFIAEAKELMVFAGFNLRG